MKFEKIEFPNENAKNLTGPYSPVLKVGPFVYVSGQRPIDSNGVIPEGIEAQTAQCLRNLEAQLKLAGADMKDVIRTHVFLADLNDFAVMNTVYKERFPAPYPTRTTVGAQLRGILVEIECEAVLPQE